MVKGLSCLLLVWGFWWWPSPALALVGGVEVREEQHPSVVMIVSTRGSVCGGAVLDARHVVTAGHCVSPKARYALAERQGSTGQAQLWEVERVFLHPRFRADGISKRTFSIDVAVLRLASPLPSHRTPVLLWSGERPAFGQTVDVYGFGQSDERDAESVGPLRHLRLNVSAPLSKVQLRLKSHPSPVQGACHGDSGGPVFRDGQLLAVLSWTLGQGGREGCAYETGAALLMDQATWIRDMMAKP